MFNSQKVQYIADIAVDDAMASLQGLTEGEKDIIYDTISDTVANTMQDEWDKMQLQERCGPSMWCTLHWIAKVADNEDKPYLYINLLKVYEEGHPCKDICRPHLVKNLALLDVNKYSSMERHSIDLHNLVNRQLGKEYYPVDKAMQDYNLDCDSCTFNAHTKKV